VQFEATKPAGADLLSSIRSKYLSSLDEDQKLRIFDLTTRVSRELHRWALRYPLIRKVRVWPVCLSVAAGAPFASANVLTSMARMGLWIFTIDDMFDEEMVPYSELQRRVAHYHDILAGGRINPQANRDTMALALHNIREDLRSYPLFADLQDEWAEAIARTLDAMMREHEWRVSFQSSGTIPLLPNYFAYLNFGLYSCGYPPNVWTTLIALGDPSVLQHLARFKEMERTTSVCVRLANDLKSYAKELDEGKINAVVIRQYEAMARGLSAPQALASAQEVVKQDLWQELQHCNSLQTQIRTSSLQPERAIADTARFVCDFYEHHDYHTYGAGTVRQ
jgi:hypothetical protein